LNLGIVVRHNPEVTSIASALEPQRDGVRIIRTAAQFVALLALIWCVFFAVYRAFPYVRNGADIVYETKRRLLESSLDSNVVIFGNSKVLSGFIPALFDSVCDAYSFNFGLPNEPRFIDNLERLLNHVPVPQRVLLTIAHSEREHRSPLFHYLDDDRTTSEHLFPFRHFPRDLMVFLLRSRAYGGPAAFYRQTAGAVARMQADRGYYFIEGQSPFPGHRLPANFHLRSDRPGFVNARHALNDADLRRLRSLAESRDVQIWFVPSYFRAVEYAQPPSENPELRAMVRTSSHFHLAGPDYWLLADEYFSDAVHLNPTGAREYTRRLAELIGRETSN
jgi:hypothetical protein